MKRPGDRLRALACRCFDTRTMQRVVDPAIADLQREPVSIAGYAAVLKVMLMCGWQEVTMSQHEWTSDDRRALTRALAGAAIVTVLVTLGLEAPFVPYAWHPGSVDQKLPLYLAPQGLPLAIAIGVTLGMLFGLEGRQFSRRVRAWLLVLASAASIVSFVDLAWITPAGQQAFRMAVFGHPGMMRDAPELTLGELWQFTSPDFVFNFHSRFALGCAPLVLAVFALTIVRSQRTRRWTVGLTAMAVFVGYYIVLYGGRSLALDGKVPAYAAAWLPNVTLVLLSAAMAALSARRRRDLMTTGLNAKA